MAEIHCVCMRRRQAARLISNSIAGEARKKLGSLYGVESDTWKRPGIFHSKLVLEKYVMNNESDGLYIVYPKLYPPI
jgi:hypothetical protein